MELLYFLPSCLENAKTVFALCVRHVGTVQRVGLPHHPTRQIVPTPPESVKDTLTVVWVIDEYVFRRSPAQCIILRTLINMNKPKVFLSFSSHN